MSNAVLTPSATKVVTGIVRLSYANIWEPKSINGSDPKYSVSLLIPKSDTATIEKIKAATEAAVQEGKASKFGNKTPGNLKYPLRDGDIDRPDDEVYAGHYFINANSTQEPDIVDLYRERITDETLVYSGCYARAVVNFYAFNTNGNKGVAVGLNGIQRVRDGERLGGRGNAVNDFDDGFEADGADDDFLN